MSFIFYVFNVLLYPVYIKDIQIDEHEICFMKHESVWSLL